MIAGFRNTLKVTLSNHILEELYLLHKQMMLNSSKLDNSGGGKVDWIESERCSINKDNGLNIKTSKMEIYLSVHQYIMTMKESAITLRKKDS